MSTLFKGGISNVELDDAVGFASPTSIPGIMKETKIEFMTPTEENALNKPVGAGKGVKADIITEDQTQNTWLPEIQTAEANHSELFFRISGLTTAQKLVLKSCTVYTHIVPTEAGKNWKRLIHVEGFADSEANLMALTLA